MKQSEVLDYLLKVSEKMKNIGGGILKEQVQTSIIDINQWEWAQGVGLYGLLRYYQITKCDKTLHFLTDWFDNNIEKGLPLPNINSTAPLLTLTYLYEITKKQEYLDICMSRAEWLIHELPRTEENGFQHLGAGTPLEEVAAYTKEQLWVDTIFMAVLFLARCAKLSDKAAYLEESIRQILLHIKYLYDKKTGLWFHGWSFIKRNNFSEALWGRGNSWFTSGIVDYFEITGITGGLRWFMESALLEQVKALKKYQHEDGMWSTLVNLKDSYKETSATAGFTYGILKAVRLHILPTEYKQVGISGLKALISNIAEDGTVLNVSYGTGILEIDDYKNVPICPMTYGQALVILALTEALYLEEDELCV